MHSKHSRHSAPMVEPPAADMGSHPAAEAVDTIFLSPTQVPVCNYNLSFINYD